MLLSPAIVLHIGYGRMERGREGGKEGRGGREGEREREREKKRERETIRVRFKEIQVSVHTYVHRAVQ